MSQIMLALIAITTQLSAQTAGPLPTSLDLSTIRELVVQHDGRWPPLDTVARQTVESVTGSERFRGQDPVLVLLGWTFAPRTWQREPVISIPNAELRWELELPADKTVFSYGELLSPGPLLDQLDGLRHMARGQKMDALQAKVSEISGKLMLLQTAFNGELIRPVPHPTEIAGRWTPIGSEASGTTATVADAWDALEDGFVSGNAAAFSQASNSLVAALGALPAATRPSRKLIDTELRYNRLNPFRFGWMVMLGGALISALGMLVRKRWLDVFWLVAVIAGFGLVTWGISMRWQIAGRVPASNMYESLLFLSWGAGLFAIAAALFLRQRLVVLTSSLMAGIALMLSDVLPMNSYIGPIMPVLMDTVWMAIHVPVIMVSYSVLALGALAAHVQIVLMAVAPRERRMHDTVDKLHYWYIHIGSILLLAGIVTGSMWAASSWGRYWGWDPKEVWSLVALLGYLAILHVRISAEKVRPWAYALAAVAMVALFVVVVPKLPQTGYSAAALAATGVAMVVAVLGVGQFATALKSVLCFWLIIMTYVGVNYILGTGLHSYGFGTGAAARWMLLTGAIDLGLIAVCTAIYLIRRDVSAATAPRTV